MTRSTQTPKPKHKLSKRNSQLTIAASFFNNLSFVLPIWLIFGANELGYSYTTTTALFMIIWLGGALFEVPTGALADRLGRRKAYVVGSLIISIFPIAYVVHAPVAVIAAVNLVAAFGAALRSGALVPLVYDSFTKDGRSDSDYHNFLSNEKTMQFIARALSGWAGGLLYAINPVLPFIAASGAYLMTLVCGWLTIDVSSRSTLTNRMQTAAAFVAMRKKDLIVLAITSYIVLNLVAEAVWTAYPALFEQDGLSPAAIGGLFSAIAIISAIGARSVRFVMKRFGVIRIQLISASFATVTLLLLNSQSDYLHLLAIVPLSFAFGIILTPITATVQKHVDKKLHSTALSILALVKTGSYGVASIAVGLTIDWFGIQQTRRILLVEAVIALFIIAMICLRNRSRDEILTTGKNLI